LTEENEYFFKPELEQQSEKEVVYSVDNLPVFQQARQKWHDAQQAKEMHNFREIDLVGTQSGDNNELSEEYEFNN
jgi:hypothetical protein